MPLTLRTAHGDAAPHAPAIPLRRAIASVMPVISRCRRSARRASSDWRLPRCWSSAPAAWVRRLRCTWRRRASGPSAWSTTTASRSATCSARCCSPPPRWAPARRQAARARLLALNPAAAMSSPTPVKLTAAQCRGTVRALRRRHRRHRPPRGALPDQRCLRAAGQAAGQRRHPSLRRPGHDLCAGHAAPAIAACIRRAPTTPGAQLRGGRRAGRAARRDGQPAGHRGHQAAARHRRAAGRAGCWSTTRCRCRSTNSASSAARDCAVCGEHPTITPYSRIHEEEALEQDHRMDPGSSWPRS